MRQRGFSKPTNEKPEYNRAQPNKHMTNIKITKIESNSIEGILNSPSGLNIPIKFIGSAIGYFQDKGKNDTLVIVDPSIINVYKDSVMKYPMTNISTDDMMGKIIIRGDNGYANSSVIIPQDQIKMMWCDKFDATFQEWNIDLV
jgi:hypothetical protein